MVYIADVRISGPDLPLHYTRSALPELFLRYEYQTGGSETTRSFATAEGVAWDDLEAHLADDPDVSGFTRLSGDSDRSLYCFQLADEVPDLVAILTDLEIHVLHIVGNAEGWRGTTQTAEKENLQTFREFCRERGITFSVERLRETDGYVGGIRLPQVVGTELTDAQRTALVTAHERGYFETPRSTTLQTVADELGISSSAAGRRLMRAVSVLVTEARQHMPQTSEDR